MKFGQKDVEDGPHVPGDVLAQLRVVAARVGRHLVPDLLHAAATMSSIEARTAAAIRAIAGSAALIGSILASWHVRGRSIRVPGSRLVRLGDQRGG